MTTQIGVEFTIAHESLFCGTFVARRTADKEGAEAPTSKRHEAIPCPSYLAFSRQSI